MKRFETIYQVECACGISQMTNGEKSVKSDSVLTHCLTCKQKYKIISKKENIRDVIKIISGMEVGGS